MSPTRASLHKVFLECLQTILKPLVRLTLHCGLGYSEFSAAVRDVFIDVASAEFGIRGRPANIAKISAMTGLPRKVISRFRANKTGMDWSPDNEANPINTVIHYWRFDNDYCHSFGDAKELPYDGEGSFAELAKKYAGDIPASTIRAELLRSGIAVRADNGLLRLLRTYSFPEHLNEDFLRNAAFSIHHHAETLVHNALLVARGSVTEAEHRQSGRFERFAWTRRLDAAGLDDLQQWVRSEGARFLEHADQYIAEREGVNDPGTTDSPLVSGVGVYFFSGQQSKQ